MIANRGEIAVRIIRTCKELGINTVAVFSEPDQKSQHALLADEAWPIGPAAASESYLDQKKIVEVAKKSGADAIHPGYGFLSENAEFAELVEDSGIIFIGPPAEAIRLMGDKITSKQTVKQFDVPMVPGMDEPVNDIPAAKKIAADIGYPVMVKASAGGGGKGMRIVENEAEFESQMERAQSEARNSFGNDAVFVEKFIANPKHIEVQILGDQHGNIVHLFERECSIQRRHQKVIEEAPSALMSEEKRVEIGHAAIEVARSCGYYGAGTVEFVADLDFNFYFLEMNTRLQVEHPVTEEVSGIDLVKEQINIAEGNKLPFGQEDLNINGHSIELRVYAENPEGFLPDTGTLNEYEAPKGPGIRVDDGFKTGDDISIYYDPMIAKLVTWGKDRDQAIRRLVRAIEEYHIDGVKTTLPIGKFVLEHPDFQGGKFTTKFIEQFYSYDKLFPPLTEEEKKLAALIGVIEYESQASTKVEPSPSNWRDRLIG